MMIEAPSRERFIGCYHAVVRAAERRFVGETADELPTNELQTTEGVASGRVAAGAGGAGGAG